MQAIALKDVRREYAGGRGVLGVSLEVRCGHCYALLGRNGSGKSTIVRMICGLERPSAGTVHVLGHAVSSGSRRHLPMTGVALDTCAQWENLSGAQNAWFAARSHGLPCQEAQARVLNLMAAAGLSEQASDSVAHYSYGMRRKLGIVQALCHDPEVLVLDEPTAGVDAQFQVVLSEMIDDRSARGKVTFVASNDPAWTAAVATRVGFLESGRMVTEGSVDELIAEVATAQEIRIVLDRPTALSDPEIPGLRSFSQDGTTIVALVDEAPVALVDMVQWISRRGLGVRSVEVSGASLRDAFLLKTGRAIRA